MPSDEDTRKSESARRKEIKAGEDARFDAYENAKELVSDKTGYTFDPKYQNDLKPDQITDYISSFLNQTNAGTRPDSVKMPLISEDKKDTTFYPILDEILPKKKAQSSDDPELEYYEDAVEFVKNNPNHEKSSWLLSHPDIKDLPRRGK